MKLTLLFLDKTKPDNFYLQMARGMAWGIITGLILVGLWQFVK